MDLGVNAEKKTNGMYCMEPLRAGVVLRVSCSGCGASSGLAEDAI